MQTDLLLDSFLWSADTRADLEEFMKSVVLGEKVHARGIFSQIFRRQSISYAQKSSKFQAANPERAEPQTDKPDPLVTVPGRFVLHAKAIANIRHLTLILVTPKSSSRSPRQREHLAKQAQAFLSVEVNHPLLEAILQRKRRRKGKNEALQVQKCREQMVEDR